MPGLEVKVGEDGLLLSQQPALEAQPPTRRPCLCLPESAPGVLPGHLGTGTHWGIPLPGRGSQAQQPQPHGDAPQLQLFLCVCVHARVTPPQRQPEEITSAGGWQRISCRSPLLTSSAGSRTAPLRTQVMHSPSPKPIYPANAPREKREHLHPEPTPALAAWPL